MAWPGLSFSCISQGHPGGRAIRIESRKLRKEVTKLQKTEAKAGARAGTIGTEGRASGESQEVESTVDVLRAL